MTEKLPTINIKGKEYVMVKDRILDFHEKYKNGSITADLVSDLNSKLIVIKAKVTPDIQNPERYFTGYSQAIVGSKGVNETAALENAETSAVGRALAMMGIGILESVASADEMNKASYTPPTSTPKANYQGTQYEGRKPAREHRLPFDANNGDKLVTGFSQKTNRDWYAIERADKKRDFINKEQYEYLMEGVSKSFSDGTPVPTVEDLPF